MLHYYRAEWIFSDRLVKGGVAEVPSAMSCCSGSCSHSSQYYPVTWLHLMRRWGILINVRFVEGGCVDRHAYIMSHMSTLVCMKKHPNLAHMHIITLENTGSQVWPHLQMGVVSMAWPVKFAFYSPIVHLCNDFCKSFLAHSEWCSAYFWQLSMVCRNQYA